MVCHSDVGLQACVCLCVVAAATANNITAAAAAARTTTTTHTHHHCCSRRRWLVQTLAREADADVDVGSTTTSLYTYPWFCLFECLFIKFYSNLDKDFVIIVQDMTLLSFSNDGSLMCQNNEKKNNFGLFGLLGQTKVREITQKKKSSLSLYFITVISRK